MSCVGDASERHELSATPFIPSLKMTARRRLATVVHQMERYKYKETENISELINICRQQENLPEHLTKKHLNSLPTWLS